MEGGKNLVFKKKEIEAISAERMSICKSCPLFTDKGTNTLDRYICDKNKKDPSTGIHGCGCALELKTRSGFDGKKSCPLDKWARVTSITEKKTTLPDQTKDGKITL